MLAARYHPEAISYLLDVIKTLDISEQAKILSQTTVTGENTLMLAARYHPKAVPALLTVINTFDKSTQKKIFIQKSNDGENTLMLAARYHPEAISYLLDVIKTLDISEQAKILSQKNKNGLNALMLAARDHPEAISYLLDVIKTLDMSEQAEILSQRAENSTMNAWSLAKYCHPAALDEIEALRRFELRVNAIRKIKGRNDWRNFIASYSIKHEADVVFYIDLILQLPISLNIGERLYYIFYSFIKNNKETYITIAKDKIIESLGTLDSNRRKNILGFLKGKILKDLVSKNLQIEYDVFFTLIGFFERWEQVEILSQKNKNGLNTLMLAARYHSEVVPALLTVINTFSKPTQKVILRQKSKNGLNALMLAIRYHSEAVPALLAVINTFDKSTQKEILSQKSNDGENALMLAKRYQPTVAVKLSEYIDNAFCATAAKGEPLASMDKQEEEQLTSKKEMEQEEIGLYPNLDLSGLENVTTSSAESLQVSVSAPPINDTSPSVDLISFDDSLSISKDSYPALLALLEDRSIPVRVISNNPRDLLADGKDNRDNSAGVLEPAVLVNLSPREPNVSEVSAIGLSSSGLEDVWKLPVVADRPSSPAQSSVRISIFPAVSKVSPTRKEATRKVALTG